MDIIIIRECEGCPFSDKITDQERLCTYYERVFDIQERKPDWCDITGVQVLHGRRKDAPG